MLTTKKLVEIVKEVKERNRKLRLYLFVHRIFGEKMGLRDGQMINNETTQVVFTGAA